MNYMTTQEAAEKWGVSEEQVKRLCAEGKVSQAAKQSCWLVPDTAEPPTQTEEKEHHHHHHHHHSHQYDDDPEYRQKVLVKKLPRQFARIAVLTVGLSVVLQLFSRWNARLGGQQQFAYIGAHIVALLVYVYGMYRMARKLRHRVRGEKNYYLGNVGAYSALVCISIFLWFFLQDGDYDWIFYMTTIFGRMDAPRAVTSLVPIVLFHVLSYILIVIEPSIAHFRHALHRRNRTKEKD